MTLQEFYDKKLELIWTCIGAIGAIISTEALKDQQKINQIHNELEKLKQINQQLTSTK
jgi:hypothetical protein